jgi:hypothetical protein
MLEKPAQVLPFKNECDVADRNYLNVQRFFNHSSRQALYIHWPALWLLCASILQGSSELRQLRYLGTLPPISY